MRFIAVPFDKQTAPREPEPGSSATLFLHRMFVTWIWGLETFEVE